MNLERHCDLCDHKKANFTQGIICGLTDRKPEFHKTCSKIALNEMFEDKLKMINVEYEQIRRIKVRSYVYFGVYLTIGLAIVVSGYLLGKYAFDSGLISTVPILIMAAGLGPLAMAIRTLNYYRQGIETAKNKKNKIEEVLNVYGIEYDIDIKFGKEYHGNQDVSVDLKMKGLR